MDDILKKVSQFSANIPGGGQVVSALEDLIRTLSVKHIAEQFRTLTGKVAASAGGGDVKTIATALGQLGMFGFACTHELARS